jgi:hypothetical protein
VPDRPWAGVLWPWIERRLQDGTAALPCLRPDRLRAGMDRLQAAGGFGSGYLWRCVNLVEWADHLEVDWRG